MVRKPTNIGEIVVDCDSCELSHKWHECATFVTPDEKLIGQDFGNEPAPVNNPGFRVTLSQPFGLKVGKDKMMLDFTQFDLSHYRRKTRIATKTAAPISATVVKLIPVKLLNVEVGLPPLTVAGVSYC